MSVATWLIGILLGLVVGLGASVHALWTARQRTYRYAVDLAAQLGVGDRAGWAYSDMATVIVLDGKCKPKEWADA